MIHFGYTADYREWARYHDGGSPCYEPPREPAPTAQPELFQEVTMSTNDAPQLQSMHALQRVPRSCRTYVIDGLLARLEGLQGTEETVALVEALHREIAAVYEKETPA